jgi:hypothetical protein
MDKATAQELIRLAEASKASTWIRFPSPVTLAVVAIAPKSLKFDLRPYVRQPLNLDLSPEERLLRTIAGEPSEIVALSKDYYGENQLRDDHINFIVLSAHHVAELAKFLVGASGTLALLRLTVEQRQNNGPQRMPFPMKRRGGDWDEAQQRLAVYTPKR